ncbi:MAG: MFS transporter [Methyloligellaceae bacterium]
MSAILKSSAKAGLSRSDWVALFLLWFSGISLRITMLAVPPVIPLIREDLQLSEKAVGALSGLPVIVLAVGAITGSILLARLGVYRALVTGLLITAIAGAMRGLGPDIAILFAMTFVMGLGIAIMQPALPTLVGHWFINRAGLATAVYINGLFVGEIFAASLTIPIVLPLVNGRWEWSFVFWSVPVVLNAVVFMAAARTEAFANSTQGGEIMAKGWWPDWRDDRVWRTGFVLGCAATIYFTANAFLPDFLVSKGSGDWISAALTSLNLAQLPASVLILVFADRLIGRAAPFVIAGLMTVLATAGLVLTASPLWLTFWAGCLGFIAASLLILTMSLPPLCTTPNNVHRFSAGMLVIGYFLSFLSPTISGVAWDVTHLPEAAFAVVAAAGVVLVLLARSVERAAGKSE